MGNKLKSMISSTKFQEDTAIELITGSKEKESCQSISVSMKSAFPYVQLGPNTTQEVPCAIMLTSEGETGTSSRPGIDIAAVIDVSGSMWGDKINLVIKTLQFMISELGDNDRLAIVAFNNRASVVTPLKSLKEENKPDLSSLADSLRAGGGTNIVSGLDLALQIFASRRVINTVSALLLLTDGMDRNRGTSLERAISTISRYPQEYFIHCFGYGRDHDADLLSSIAEQRNGGFYYMETPETIASAFSSCLGELISIVADSIEVRLVTQPCEVPFSMVKVYSESGDSSFGMNPLLSNDRKESVFLLKFPEFEGSIHTQINPVLAFVKYKEVETGRVVEVQSQLTLEAIDNSEEVKHIEVDEDVMLNFYRVKGADILKEAKELGDSQQFEAAQQILRAGADELRCSVVGNHPAIKILADDLESAISRFSSAMEWERGGKAELRSKYKGHQEKRAAHVECYQNIATVMMKSKAANYY